MGEDEAGVGRLSGEGFAGFEFMRGDRRERGCDSFLLKFGTKCCDVALLSFLSELERFAGCEFMREERWMNRWVDE